MKDSQMPQISQQYNQCEFLIQSVTELDRKPRHIKEKEQNYVST